MVLLACKFKMYFLAVALLHQEGRNITHVHIILNNNALFQELDLADVTITHALFNLFSGKIILTLFKIATLLVHSKKKCMHISVLPAFVLITDDVK